MKVLHQSREVGIRGSGAPGPACGRAPAFTRPGRRSGGTGAAPARPAAQAPAPAAAPGALRLPRGVQRVTSVEGITEYRLANGLQVLLFPDPSKQTITVNVTYKVGSRHENYGETGMAHLLEHLVFKGTPKHPNIPQELTERGARPNGSTWTDRTNYFETFAATEDNLRWALDLEADRMVNSFIAKKDLDSEMTVVRNELESGENSPTGVLLDRVMSTAYLWHNYGKSTIGSRSDLENVPIDRLQAFYRTHYQPDNAVLLVAGTLRGTARAGPGGAVFRRDSQAGPRAAEALHGRADAGRRAQRDGAPRGRRAVGDVGLPRAGGLGPGVRGHRPRDAGPRRHALGPAAQGAGRDQARQPDLRRQLPVPRPRAAPTSPRRSAPTRRWTTRATG